MIEIIFILLLSGIFSGIEIAYVSASKLKIALNKEKGGRSWSILSEMLEKPSDFLSTLLVGNNIALVIFGSLMANVLTFTAYGFSEPIILILQTIATTIIVLIFGEFLPKALFRINPDRVLAFFAVPFKYLIFYPLKPVTWIFVFMSKVVIKLIMGKAFEESSTVISRLELNYFLKTQVSLDSENIDEEDDELNTEFFEKALFLKDVKVKECMVPRTEIEAIDGSSTIEDLKKKFIETKLSRIIIYNDNIDQLLGYAHHHSLLSKPNSISEILFELVVVPDSMSAQDLLNKFISEEKTIAWVVDEFGGTAGIVTLEDLIEEIFGEIQDEHDEEVFIEQELDEKTFLFSGRLEIDHLNEKYNFELPTGEYETLAGYVVTENEDIPNEGETVELGNFLFFIEKASGKRIDVIRMTNTEKID